MFGGIAHSPWKKNGTFYGGCRMLDWSMLMLCDSPKRCHGLEKHQPSSKPRPFPVQGMADLVVGCVVGVAGDHASCLFSLLPVAQVYPASGINANIQVHLHSLNMGTSLQMAAWN